MAGVRIKKAKAKRDADAIARLVQESVARVDQLAPEALRAVMPALTAARNEFRKGLGKWLATRDPKLKYTALQHATALRSIEATFEHVRQLDPAVTRGLTFARKATGTLSVQNLDREITRLGAAFGETLTVPALDTAALVAKGDRLLWKQHRRSARRYAGQVGDDIRQQLAIGMVKGETIQQMVNRLVKLGGPRFGGDAADALFRRHRYWAERLVRTEAMHAYNLQHVEAIRAMNASRARGDEPWLLMWESSADLVTCHRCKRLHGKTRTLGGTFAGGYKQPPIHPHDRCVVIAWRKSWGKRETLTLTPSERAAARREAKPREPKAERAIAPAKQRAAPAPAPAPAPEPVRSVSLPQAGKPETQATRRTADPDPVAAIAPTERKNPKRVAAARIAAAASVERRREIHSAARSNLPRELHVAWDKEGHKFMREEADRIRGVKDRVNASSTLSQAFAEKYGSGDESVHGNEGDRFFKRAEIEAKHAETWADEQERKYYAAARDAARHDGEIDAHGELTERGRAAPVAFPGTSNDDDDPPF